MTTPYYSDWRTRSWTCSSCTWTGSGGEATIEPFNDLFELNCASCDSRLTLISYPMVEEVRLAAASGNVEAIKDLASIDRRPEV